jgi:hypothetical protein
VIVKIATTPVGLDGLYLECLTHHLSEEKWRATSAALVPGEEGVMVQQTLYKAYSQEYPEVPGAFENLMTRKTLQFALRIAFRCVLHRCGNQDIRR